MSRATGKRPRPQRPAYGWVPDLPDHRDHVYGTTYGVPAALPPRADLRAHCPPVENQGPINSCTGNALAGALGEMRACLASGFPFVFGFTVYESCESPQVARSGVLDMPGLGEQAVGGHAVLAVGYDDGTRRFIVRNSWGTRWGQRGYFTMP